MRRPRPGTQGGSDEFEVTHDQERADIEQRTPAPAQESQQADEPERAQGIGAFGAGDAPQRPSTTDHHGGRDRNATVDAQELGPAQDERGEVDQPVTGRYVGRHVLETVDVDLEQRRERVFDGTREGDHHGHLRAYERCLAAQHREQQEPGGDAGHPLAGEGTVPVEDEDGGDPGEDERRRDQVTWRPGPRGAHPPDGPASVRSLDSRAAPMIPASFFSAAGTISVRRSRSGRNFSDFLLTPPPTTNRSGQRRFSSAV